MNFNAPIIPLCLICDVTGMLGHFCIFDGKSVDRLPFMDYNFQYEYSLCVSTLWQSLPSIHIIYLAGIHDFLNVLFSIRSSVEE